MRQKVGVVAVAQTKYEPSKPAVRDTELVFEVVDKVLRETGLNFAEDGTGIDAAVTCNQDFWEGRTVSDCLVGEVCGSHLRAEEKVAEDGLHGIQYAAMQVLSGECNVVLVVANCKESQTVGHIIENAAFDPAYQRSLGVDFLAAAALQAKRYMHKYGISAEEVATVAVKNLRNAKNNPLAQRALPGVTTKDVLASEVLSSPIHALEAKPVSDGACAFIIASEERARKLTDTPVWIEGFGSAYDSFYLGDRDLADCASLEAAARQAYKMAGITQPEKEIDLFELSEVYAYQELLWMEGLGLCPRGEGAKLCTSGKTAYGGPIPVNVSGGVLSGNPINVAGMARAAEVVLQLRGEAKGRQMERAGAGLAHAVGGPCGQYHGVLILKR